MNDRSRAEGDIASGGGGDIGIYLSGSEAVRPHEVVRIRLEKRERCAGVISEENHRLLAGSANDKRISPALVFRISASRISGINANGFGLFIFPSLEIEVGTAGRVGGEVPTVD